MQLSNTIVLLVAGLGLLTGVVLALMRQRAVRRSEQHEHAPAGRRDDPRHGGSDGDRAGREGRREKRDQDCPDL